MYCCENIHRSYTAVSATFKVSCTAAQLSQLLSKSPVDLREALRSFNIAVFYESYLVAPCMHLHNRRCFKELLTMLQQGQRSLSTAPWGAHLEVLESTGEVAQSVWEDWVFVLHRFTFSLYIASLLCYVTISYMSFEIS
jgi:hypothetical protein